MASNFNCIDVGCHKGEILDSILSLAPDGKHFAFEPLPNFYQSLIKKYKGKATIFSYALSDHTGNSTFQFVKNAPAYSGIKKRKYETEITDIEEIQVELKTLDDVIPNELPIHFIKIDVEGGEMGVLKGAQKLLLQNKPYIIFECGLGASEFYGTKPEDVFNFITSEIGLKISRLKSFVANNSSLTFSEFIDCYNHKKEYYFIAHI